MQFFRGINDAAVNRNMTVQICAGNAPHFMTALDLPAFTQARGSIDYDWEQSGTDINSTTIL